MRKLTFLATTFLMLFSCCLGPTVNRPASQNSIPDEERLFLAFLNLEKMPESISGFRGEGADVFPVFLSSGYFNYQAEPSYFDMLTNHDRFIEESGFNARIHQVDCTGHGFPSDFSWWTKESININGKTCFQGTIFPYVHYILYDSQTKQVIHFVTGMRE